MDALTFRTPKLLRKFTSSQGKDKQPIIEVDYEKMLEGLGLTYEQFVDLCILCGCDYCSTIRGIGSKVRVVLLCCDLAIFLSHLCHAYFNTDSH